MDAMRWLVAGVVAAALVGCDGEVQVAGSSGSGAGGGVGGGGGEGASWPSDSVSDKIDLLIVVDNSRSMADKQEVLKLGVASLVRRFTNPRCIDGDGAASPAQPQTAAEACPPGYAREMAAVTDMHIGVISSSLGGHGADACTTSADENGKAHLSDKSDGSGSETGGVQTYQGKGFLAWDPLGAKQPPGEADEDALTADLGALVAGVGEVGCGYEATLEAWYRFLIEPDPHDDVVVNGAEAELVGTDQVLLDQRAAFLRPDSNLVIVMLSDENDCSVRDGGQYFFASQIYQPGGTGPFHLPRPRAACATNPYDPCCRSCGEPPGPGCDTSQDQCDTLLSSLEDSINLRCFDQKRRFGIDFLYPVARYVDGLTNGEISDRHGNVVHNPLFTGERAPSQVYLTGIVGVPWQDIARRNASGAPDLIAGQSAGGAPIGGLQSAAERVAHDTWALVLGDPQGGVQPTDPHMIESIDPRSGQNPVTGDAIAPPTAGADANPINGHEASIPDRNDLQYACIWPLLTPRDCTTTSAACDCQIPGDNPLCQNPADDSYGQIQYAAKAYPGRRQLEVLRALGDRAVLGSVCPAQLADPESADYGYRAVFDALGDAVKRSVVE